MDGLTRRYGAFTAVDAVTFTVQDEPDAYVTRDADGRVSLGMRHAGFGWIAFAFTDNSAQAIWRQLGEMLSGTPTDLLQANQRG